MKSFFEFVLFLQELLGFKNFYFGFWSSVLDTGGNEPFANLVIAVLKIMSSGRSLSVLGFTTSLWLLF